MVLSRLGTGVLKFARRRSASGEKRMRRHHLGGGILVAVSLLAGCAEWQSGVNSLNKLRLQVGMTRDEVIATMGKPQIREAYGRTEFLIYRTDFPVSTGKADFTPIGIVNGKVTGWGRDFYDETRRKRVEANASKKQQ
jgi:Protein of unknown function (DUF3192)